MLASKGMKMYLQYISIHSVIMGNNYTDETAKEFLILTRQAGAQPLTRYYK